MSLDHTHWALKAKQTSLFNKRSTLSGNMLWEPGGTFYIPHVYQHTYRTQVMGGKGTSLGFVRISLSAGFAAAALHIGALVLYFYLFFCVFSGCVNSASVVFGVMLTPCLSKRYADRREEARSSSASLL